jgi:hypothetical protein
MRQPVFGKYHAPGKPMTSTVVAISLAYAAIGVLLLSLGLSARLAWWAKAVAIVVTSAFFIEAFFATNGLLGWPSGGPLPARFQLLWTRVVEPDVRSGNSGAIYFWVEEVDESNVPSGAPKSYQLPYSRPLADRALKARDEIMAGHPQQGLAGDPDTQDQIPGEDKKREDGAQTRPAQVELKGGLRTDSGTAKIEMDAFLQQAPPVRFSPMPPPTLPPKTP